eukprot:CAMPEP_0184288840 /NCGR_PEP_ID=MMETSP1049-20130417/1328_1 /TAXON_ID=77928 /ORGANISM="Proteomonas sulcata, Strain CCMP704" /LENGTH=223 /DNA_ID=CAMNT_0026595407 /DNA_START=45 /DNA_END=714 /DNA_ORIENTATION=-
MEEGDRMDTEAQQPAQAQPNFATDASGQGFVNFAEMVAQLHEDENFGALPAVSHEVDAEQDEEGEDQATEEDDDIDDDTDDSMDEDEEEAAASLGGEQAGQRRGCQHYRRGCKLVSPCCGEIYWCRFCHDASQDQGGPNAHKLDRHAVTEVVCCRCELRQPVAPSCCDPECGNKFGEYSCMICNFFDDDLTKQPSTAMDAEYAEWVEGRTFSIVIFAGAATRW